MAKLMKAVEKVVVVVEEEEVEPKGAGFLLEDLQRMVRGPVQFIDIGLGQVLVVNEEGKLMGLPINRKATDLLRQRAKEHGLGEKTATTFLVGNVLLCQRKGGVLK